MSKQKITYENSNFDYDALNDTFYVYNADQQYVSSQIFDDIIMDVGENNVFVGVEILNASKKFNVSSYEFLAPVRLRLTYDIKDDEISMLIEFTFVKRNQSIVRTMSAVGVNDMNLAPASATFALA